MARGGFWRNLACEQEVEHALLTRCKGHVLVKQLGEFSDEAAMNLGRLGASGERYGRFLAEERASIRSHALLLDMSQEMAAAVLFARSEARMEREALGAPDDVLIGLGSTLVAGVSSANIFAQSCVDPLRPVRLEIPPEVARDFMLTNLRVGRNSQFISPGCIPLSSFNDNRFHYLKLEMDVLQASQFLTVSVTNISTFARNLQGVVVCRKVR